MPEITLEHVTRKFGKFVAVDDLSLKIDDHSFIVLLGPSGCGKTTTLRMIAGLDSPTEGRIAIDGKTVFSSEEGIDVPPAKRNVGFLFQNYALWPHMTVYQNIAFGLENMKWPKDKIQSKVQELLEMLRISEFGKRYPAELSGGQQQRVAIARTLATSPSILFMDEPLSNLDAKLRLEMRGELKRLHKTTNSTFIYVTHDQLEAMTLSTRISLLKNGVLQQYAPPLDVYRRPANTFVADFVGNPSINLVKGEVASVEGRALGIRVFGMVLSFKAEKAVPLAQGAKITLGIRPEHITVDEGEIQAKVLNSLPSGMETIVMLEVGGVQLHSVMFCDSDYVPGTDIRMRFVSDRIALFDESGAFLSLGALD